MSCEKRRNASSQASLTFSLSPIRLYISICPSIFSAHGSLSGGNTGPSVPMQEEIEDGLHYLKEALVKEDQEAALEAEEHLLKLLLELD